MFASIPEKVSFPDLEKDILAFWQTNKINFQAKKWPLDQLIKYYQGLHNIDIMIKSGVNPNSLKKSIDMLSCYYL